MTTMSYESSRNIGTVSHLRMTARGRRVLLALVSTPLVIVALALALNGGHATATDSSTPLSYVSVASGQTLWSLAEQVAPASDPRDVIAAIVSLNGLSTTDLVAGQSIAIPSEYLGE